MISKLCVLLATGIMALGLQLAMAQPPAQPPRDQCTNGCGPGGWLGTVVPNSVGTCRLKKACDGHDACYGRCLKGCGDLAGKTECRGKHCHDAASKARKSRCDTQLEKEIVDLNGGACRAVAWAYRTAVEKCGCAYFNGFAAVDEKVKRERFQKDFEEALRAYEYGQRNPRTIDLELQRRTLQRLSEVDPLSENRLVFLAEGEVKPRLALKSERPRAPRFGPPGERLMLNGIDVTDMEVDGKRFDLDDVRGRRDFDASGLKQQKVKVK